MTLNDNHSTIIPVERSESRDPCHLSVSLMDSMGPGSRSFAACPG